MNIKPYQILEKNITNNLYKKVFKKGSVLNFMIWVLNARIKKAIINLKYRKNEI